MSPPVRDDDAPDARDVDRAVAEAAAHPPQPVPDQPVDGDWTPESGGVPPGDAEAPAEEGPLESLGRAISQPVKDAAEDDEKLQTGR